MIAHWMSYHTSGSFYRLKKSVKASVRTVRIDAPRSLLSFIVSYCDQGFSQNRMWTIKERRVDNEI